MHGIQRDCPHFLRQVIHIVHHVIHNRTIFGALPLCITCGRRGPRLHTPVFHSTVAAIFRRGRRRGRQDSGADSDGRAARVGTAATTGRRDGGADSGRRGVTAATTGQRRRGGGGGLAAGHGSAAPKGGAARDRDEGPARPGSGRARVKNRWMAGDRPLQTAAVGGLSRKASAPLPPVRDFGGGTGARPGPLCCPPGLSGDSGVATALRRATRRARGSAPP